MKSKKVKEDPYAGRKSIYTFFLYVGIFIILMAGYSYGATFFKAPKEDVLKVGLGAFGILIGLTSIAFDLLGSVKADNVNSIQGAAQRLFLGAIIVLLMVLTTYINRSIVEDGIENFNDHFVKTLRLLASGFLGFAAVLTSLAMNTIGKYLIHTHFDRLEND